MYVINNVVSINALAVLHKNKTLADDLILGEVGTVFSFGTG